MHPESHSGATSPVAHPDGAVPDSDLAETLLARVDDIEGQLRAIPTASDEKALRELRRTIEALSKRDPKFEERVTNRVDVVADRVETVAKTVSTTAAGLAARDGELSQLRRELEAASGRTDAAVADLRRSVDPAALPELKRALAALSEQKLPRGIEGRVEDLTAKLGMLSQRVDSVSSTASTTATGLAGRDGDMIALRRAYESEAARIAADLADVRKSIDPAPVAELRQAVKELSDAAFGQKRSTQRHLDEVGAKIDTLGDRLDSFAASVTATATQVSGSESEISALRASVDDGASRLSSLVTELNKALAALAARAAALEDADAETARLLDAQGSVVDGKVDDLAARLDSLTTTVETTSDQLGQQNAQLVASEHRFQEASGKVDDLAARLDSLTTTVETTSDQLGQQNAQLEASEHRFQEASARVDGLVGELARALEEFPDPDFLEQSLQPRLDELAGQVADLSGQLAHVETTLSQQTQGTASESAELHRLLLAERGKVDDLTSRLDSLANSAAATATRISGGEEEISALRASVEEDASRLRPVVGELKQTVDALSARATTLEEADGEAARRLDARVSDVSGSVDDLAARLDSLNASVATTTEHLRDRDVEISALRSEIAQRFDAVEREREVSTEAARAAEQSSKTVGTRVEELAARLEAADEQRDGATAEVTRLAAILEVERASFRARLDTLAAAQEKWTGELSGDQLERRLAGRFDELESGRKAMAAELDRISSALDEQRASVQAQLEALAAALSLPAPSTQHSSLEARLDELTQKLDEVDQRGIAVASDFTRTRTLWPTALRSLEARLDEIAPRPNEPAASLEEQPLIARPNDGISQAEPAAAETVSSPEREPNREPSSENTVAQPVTSVGADVVRLRAADP